MRRPCGWLLSALVADEAVDWVHLFTKTDAAVPLRLLHQKRWQTLLGRALGTASLGSISNHCPSQSNSDLWSVRLEEAPGRSWNTWSPGPWELMFWPSWAISQDPWPSRPASEFSPLIQWGKWVSRAKEHGILMGSCSSFAPVAVSTPPLKLIQCFFTSIFGPLIMHWVWWETTRGENIGSK